MNANSWSIFCPFVSFSFPYIFFSFLLFSFVALSQTRINNLSFPGISFVRERSYRRVRFGINEKTFMNCGKVIEGHRGERAKGYIEIFSWQRLKMSQLDSRKDEKFSRRIIFLFYFSSLSPSLRISSLRAITFFFLLISLFGGVRVERNRRIVFK